MQQLLAHLQGQMFNASALAQALGGASHTTAARYADALVDTLMVRRLPHIHAMYAGDEAVFGIESGEVIDGNLPRRQTRLVQAWIELHRDELTADWSLAVKGEPVFPIDPLR